STSRCARPGATPLTAPPTCRRRSPGGSSSKVLRKWCWGRRRNRRRAVFALCYSPPMSSVLIKNLGTLVTGRLESPLRAADSMFIRDGIIQAIGNGLNQSADQIIDANGITAIPGLIDSHSHPSIGEYTPAQNSLSWITNYMHGGVTALISAGELHLPGLPLPPDPRTALSVAIVTK